MTKIQGFILMIMVFFGVIALNAGITAIERKIDGADTLDGKVHVIAEREYKSIEFGRVYVLEYMIDGHYYSPLFHTITEFDSAKEALGLETAW